jgi:hypothetical protein
MVDGRDGLSTPEASSPRPWIKMIAADWEGLAGVDVGGRTMGGCLCGDMI